MYLCVFDQCDCVVSVGVVVDYKTCGLFRSCIKSQQKVKRGRRKKSTKQILVGDTWWKSQLKMEKVRIREEIFQLLSTVFHSNNFIYYKNT